MIQFSETLQACIAKCGILAVVTVETPELAVELSKVLFQSGVGGIELTLRTPSALDCLKAVVAEVPEIIAGAGTVITPHQVESVVEAGAAFAVSPGCNPTVLAVASACSLPFAPGVATPSDIEHAVMAGANVLKFFPAETSGGLAHLKAMAAPFRHLNLKYIPLGGLRSDNFISYLQHSDCLAIGGSWLAPAEAINERNWSSIRNNCSAALQAIQHSHTQ